MFLAVIFWHVQFGFTIRNFSPEKFHKHPNSTFWHRSTHFWSQWVLLFYLPSSQLHSLWGHAKFYFEPSTDESKGPLENCALSLQRKRKIRGNQLLPLYSISHHLCSLIHFIVYQEEWSIKNPGKMTHRRKQCQSTKSRGKTRVKV